VSLTEMRFAIPLAILVAAAAAGADEASAERGRYLYEAADCAGCHGLGSPTGGLALKTPFGIFHAPNITPDRETGIGAWSEADFRRALRDGVGPNGKQLFPVFPFPSFTAMTDADIGDLFAYLRTLAPAAQPNKRHELRFPFGWRRLMAAWRDLFFKPGPYRPDPARDAEWNRGNYLVHAVAHCGECHTPRNAFGALEESRAFAGNIGGPDGQNAPNITPDLVTGIGKWSIADIEQLLKSGLTPDYDMVGSGMRAVVRGTARLTDADRHAIAVYVKTVPAVRTEPRPESASAK
jgi:mono/diheme cytochrome c family protein